MEAAKEDNLEIEVIIIDSLTGFVSLTDILQDQVNPSEIDEFRYTIVTDNLHDIAMICFSVQRVCQKKNYLKCLFTIVLLLNIEEIHIIKVILSMPMIQWHYGLILIFKLVISNAKWIITLAEVAFKDEICKIIQDWGKINVAVQNME